MQWTEELSTGIDAIDHQHKELFNRINRLIDAVKRGKCKYIIEATITFLEDCAVSHFSEEERYMRRLDYPGYHKQKTEHTRFLSSVSRLKHALEEEGSGSYPLSVATIQMTVDWIQEHIETTDKVLGAFLKGKL